MTAKHNVLSIQEQSNILARMKRAYTDSRLNVLTAEVDTSDYTFSAVFHAKFYTIFILNKRFWSKILCCYVDSQSYQHLEFNYLEFNYCEIWPTYLLSKQEL